MTKMDITIDDIAEMSPREAQEWVWTHLDGLDDLPADVHEAIFDRSNPS